MVLVTGDLPAQHIECILREEALTSNKRFIIVLHKTNIHVLCKVYCYYVRVSLCYKFTLCNMEHEELVHTYYVNDKSYTGEQFRHLLDFIIT